MEPTRESTARFHRRLLGYDRREVERALTSTTDDLRRARARCEELAASATNLDRIGAQVADMLRALAEHAVELQDDAAAAAERTLSEAQNDAARIRADAAAVLAAARAEADAILEETRLKQAAAGTRRQAVVAALHVAMDQISQLTKSIHELGPEVGDDQASDHGDGEGHEAPSAGSTREGARARLTAWSRPESASTVIHLPSPAAPADIGSGPEAGAAEAPDPTTQTSEEIQESLAVALERLRRWTTAGS